MKTVSLRIYGKVQGVFYRKSARNKAKELNLTGKVRNELDDSVYIIASGDSGQIDLFILWCRQGPPRAEVTDLRITELPYEDFNDFIIER